MFKTVEMPLYTAACTLLMGIYIFDFLFYMVVSMVSRLYHSQRDRAKERHLSKGSEPKVVIQLPMYNEGEYGTRVIGFCCKLEWPADKLLIQVLDDSTNEKVRQKIDDCVADACDMGYKVERVRRTNRQGYKAGALHEAVST